MATPVKPLSAVPRPVLLALGLACALQLGFALQQQASRPQARALEPPPPLALLRLASLGETAAASRVAMLYVQGLDEQPGLSLAWRELDYPTLLAWLARALDLDPRSQYPLLAASEVYGAVGDPARVRLMLDFVYARFGEDPNRRWPWLAHASLVARHRLHDMALARRYAQAIRLQASGAQVPAWARELEVFILEDMNEIDAARALVGGLLQSGQISDPNELRFLSERLDRIASGKRPGQSGQSEPAQPDAAPANAAARQ